MAGFGGFVIESAAMDKNTAWEKRVRRHVSSKEYTFLAVVQPAFRETCLSEMREKGFSVTAALDGGVEFRGKLEEAWRANLELRIPSRIYCRAAAFKAGAREELFRKAAGIPWELWLSPGIPLRIDGIAVRSRIHHEGMIADTFAEALERRFGEAGLEGPPRAGHGAPGPVQRVLVRAEGDGCTVSLDTSGDALYSRGYRAETAGAPLRETLAAALLHELGWKGEGLLCDPMTGSGTLAIEAALIAASIPPGALRSFLFESWPSFRRPAWEYLRRPKGIPIDRGACVLASDADSGTVETGRRNGLRAGTGSFVCWQQADFFHLTPDMLEKALGVFTVGPRFLIVNPPYGIRLAGGGLSFFKKLGEHIGREYRGWNVLVLFPNADALHSFGISPRRVFEFRHGGLRIKAGIY